MGKIEFGLRIPAFPIDEKRKADFVGQILNLLERTDGIFNSAWLCDHMIPWANWASPDTDNLEGWTTISYLMGIFKNLSFGNIVLCNSYRNPALLAKMTATLCTFAPNRFILGIGAGWKKDEHISFGYKFNRARERIEALEESVQIIRKMWTENVVNFNGKHFTIAGAYCNPKPDPIPPIMIGGCGERHMLRAVATHADWWNCPNLTVAEYEHKLQILKHYCEIVGRSFEALKKIWLGCIAIAKKKDKAFRIAINSPFVAKETRFNPLAATIVGSPEQVAQKLAEFVDIGVEYFIFRFLDFPNINGMELFADKVADRIG